MKTLIRSTASFLVPALCAAGLQAQVVTTWNGGAGNWSDTAFWNNGVPNAANADVFIDGGKTGVNSVVTMDGSYTVGRLTLDAGDTLNLANNVDFYLASSFAGSESIINNGTINFNSLGNGVFLHYIGANASLTGTGTINLNGSNDRIYAQNGGGDRLTIGAGSTIAGNGNLGIGQSTFTNNGLVNANQSGLTLTLQPGGGNGSDFTNGAGGIAQASNGGILQLLGGGTFSGGTFQALDGSTINIGGSANVSGTTLTTAGAGTVNLTGAATLTNATNAGALNASNNSVTYLSGTLTNNGTFNLNSSGNGDDLRFIGAATLKGTGTTNLNGANDRIYASNGGGDRLTINAGATIAGTGNLGIGQSTFTNNGTVNANQSGLTLTLQPGGGQGSDYTNGTTGVTEASNGGTLALIGGNFINGTFQALANSAVTIGSSATVNNATLATVGNGVVTLFDTATLTNVTNAGTLTASNNSVTYLVGTLTNNGVFTLASNGNGDDLRFVGASETLNGSGTINLTGSNNRIYAQNAGGDRLTIAAGATIAGTGNLGIGQSTFTNNGTVNANISGTTLTLQPGQGQDSAFTNGAAGIAEATNGGTLLLQGGGGFTGTGYQALAGSAINLAGNPNVFTATLAGSGTGSVNILDSASLTNVTLNGTINANNNSTTFLSGTLTTNGTFNLNSTGNGDDLRYTAGQVLNGTGTINLLGANDRIFAANGGNDRLTISAGLTVAGGGNLGSGQSAFTNNGTVRANVSGQTLTLQPGSDFTNGATGLAVASNGGTLTLLGGTFSGAGFQAQADSSINIGSNANLNGVTLSTTGTGTANLTDTATLTNATNAGALNASNNSVTYLSGTLTNNGTFNLNSLGNGDDLRFIGAATLAGTGTTNLNGANDRIYAPNGGGERLTINAGATIAGTGNLGIGQSTFTNNGTVNANQSGLTLTLQPGGGQGSDFTNGPTGVAAATGGGTLALVGGGNFTNNGVFAAVSGSTGGGSTLTVDAGRLTNLSGSTLTGGIYNVLSSNSSSASTLSFGGSPITANAATVVLSGPATVFNEINALAVNSGSFTVANGRNFTTAGALASSGMLVASGGSTFTATGGLTQSGVLAGDGVFSSPSMILAGTIAPGGTVSATTGAFTGGVGTLTLTGTTTLQSGTDLTFELGTTSDRLAVNGAFTLDGRLDVAALAGFGAGRYDLIDYAGGALTNNVLDLGTLPTGYNYAIDLSVPGQVDLLVTAVPEPSTGVAVLAGLGLLAFAQRRRRLA